MATATENETKLISIADRLGVADDTIALLRDKHSGLTADTPARYKQVKEAIAEVRTVRTDLEKNRKQLKEKALDYCKAVDFEAKRITELLLEIELPLKSQKALIDGEKARIKREKAEADRKRVEDELKAKRVEEEKARRKAEAERMAEQQKIADENAKLKAELDAQRAKMDRERQEMQDERNRIELEKAKHEAEVRTRQEERERIEKEEAAKRTEAERIADEKAKAESEKIRFDMMKPDADKLAGIGEQINAIVLPVCTTPEGIEALDFIADDLSTLVQHIGRFVRSMRGNAAK